MKRLTVIFVAIPLFLAATALLWWYSPIVTGNELGILLWAVFLFPAASLTGSIILLLKRHKFASYFPVYCAAIVAVIGLLTSFAPGIALVTLAAGEVGLAIVWIPLTIIQKRKRDN